MVDGSGTSKWIHDGWGRLTRFEQPGWNIDYGYLSYHDTPISMTDPSGVTGYQYDNRGNLWKLTNPVNEVTEWLYDPAGRLSQRKLGNGTWEEVSYDSRSRVTGIALKKPGATLRQHTYGYNAVSNVTSHTVGGITTSYGYDLADQLISESRLGYVASYTYDANGNRATRTVNGVTETHVSDAADKLMSISVGGNTVRSFTYDGRGRRKTDTYAGSTTTYSWDAESRLTSLARPGVTTSSFGYNGLDARVSKTDSTGTFSFKRNGAGVTDAVLSDGAATYTPGISERRGGSSKFLHSGMKNADAQSGASANVDSSRTYDAFGNLTGSSGTWSGPFGYAGGFGYQEDPDHGLRLLGHRYYDSSTGRFISKDPIGDGRNWYGYAENRPLCCADANGLCSGCVNGGVAAELAGTFGGAASTQAPVAAGAAAVDAAAAATVATGAARAAQLALNVAKGRKGLLAFLKMFGLSRNNIVTELVLEVILTTGESVRIRADVAYPVSSDTLKVYEIKNGPSADLTKNQKRAFPAIQQGATVIVRSAKLARSHFPIRKGSVVKVLLTRVRFDVDIYKGTRWGWRAPSR